MPRIVPTPGTILKQGDEVWEVVEYNGFDRMKVKILAVSRHTGTYVDVGKVYNVEKHKNAHDDEPDHFQTWEIPPEEMHRDSSQMILYLWGEGDVGIELDF